jgi:hypothetical protein
MSTNNEVIIIAEESNGETTVVEVIAANADTLVAKDGDGDTLVEEIIEAVFDHSDDTDTNETTLDNLDVSDAEVITSANDLTTLEEADSIVDSTDEFDAGMPEFNTQPDLAAAYDAAAPAQFDAADFSELNADYAGFDAGAAVVGTTVSDSTDTSENSDSEVDGEAQANFDLASDAQAKADEAVAAGDYEAAAQYREDAEDAAWQAGDDSMLHGSDASDLTMADTYQDKANDLEEQQAEYAQAGDYEAARDASRDAATYTQWGDIEGGGADHSAEAQHEYAQMDMAAWQQDIADGYQQDAETYAAQGDFESAETFQAEAGEHQDTADYYGDLGEHNGTYDQYADVPEASYGGYDYSTDYAAADYSATDYSSDYSSADYSSSYSSVDSE